MGEAGLLGGSSRNFLTPQEMELGMWNWGVGFPVSNWMSHLPVTHVKKVKKEIKIQNFGPREDCSHFYFMRPDMISFFLSFISVEIKGGFSVPWQNVPALGLSRLDGSPWPPARWALVERCCLEEPMVVQQASRGAPSPCWGSAPVPLCLAATAPSMGPINAPA